MMDSPIMKDGGKQDQENATKGLITSLDPCIIPSESERGSIVWNNDAYNFINEDCPADFANPSLWRQSQLCQKQGLFQVTEGIYQVRGLDLSNMTIVETPDQSGIIVIDPLTSVECAREALKLYEGQFSNREVKAMIYTHSHADHYGGARAITDAAKRDLPVYAPDGFLEHAVSENVYAGNAMGRRAVYMYGESLDKDPKGHIGCGLGMALSSGAPGLIAPTINVTESNSKVTVEGLEIVFQLTPGTEAPSEMNMYFPQYRALCMAENATHTLHNIQTLRGAVVRDARVWSKYLDESIVLYGGQAEVVFASHHWPIWGNEEIQTFLSAQRDTYAYLHNETVRLLNEGQTGLEIAEDFVLPPALAAAWSSRGYYGSVSHNVKAIYNRYMGWFDGNPAHLWEHPPTASAKRYVDCMGGIEKTIELAQRYTEEGDLRFAATLLSHAVFADQDNKPARSALQSVFRQLGFGAENATWRNFYLTGALELENPNRPSQIVIDTRTLIALDLEQMFDTVAIRVNGPKAWKESFTIAFMVSRMGREDSQQGWLLNLSNGAVTGHGVDYLPSSSGGFSALLTIWLTQRELAQLISGDRPDLAGLTTSGDAEIWTTLASLLTTPDPAFAIVTPEVLDL
ncbi:beta-lactamase-like protein [Aspergillus karnatakaensis]|uniref:alkyl/aryl-sulfatase n=1 Tax=Aspergillus karnatakaensis TaxID=1810916 RepID=UPI003CCE17E0